MIDLLDISGAHITIDAIGTQEKIAKKIVEQGGHYVFKAKRKPKRNYKKDIRRYFDKINNLKAHKDIIWKEVTDKKIMEEQKKEDYYLSYDIETIKNKKKMGNR